MFARLFALLPIALFMLATPAITHAQSVEISGDALSRVIDDACAARVVFLGEEPSHGGGQAIRVKADVARGLIQKCGFNHVAFESQIYDFVDLQEKYLEGAATREALYDAIGGLWSRAAEIDQLVEFLHEAAEAKRLTVSGFDINVNGATALYSQTQLARRLTLALSPERQETCFGTISRLTGWRFDRVNPKDEAFDEAVLGCAKEIEAMSLAMGGRDSTEYVLARSFHSNLDVSGASFDGLRDSVMYENLKWTIDRLAPNAKIIVWTATNHSLRSPLRSWKSMASHASRDIAVGAKSIAFVALSGAISGGGRQAEITIAEPGSLEALFAPSDGARESYIDGDQLRRAGTKRSRVLGYSQYVDNTWSEHLDGVVVMSSESPPTIVRTAKPMQAR